MFGFLAALYLVVAPATDKRAPCEVFEIDFTPTPPAGAMLKYKLHMVVTTESGKEFKDFYKLDSAASETVRDLIETHLGLNGLEVRPAGKTKFILISYKGSPIKSVEFKMEGAPQDNAPFVKKVTNSDDGKKKERRGLPERKTSMHALLSFCLVFRVPETTKPAPPEVVEIDFAPIPPIGAMLKYKVHVVVTANSGGQFKDTFSVDGLTPEGMRNWLAGHLERGDFEVRLSEKTKLIVISYKNSSIKSIEIKMEGAPQDNAPFVKRIKHPDAEKKQE